MYQIKDVIMYGSQGVCEITGIEEKSISGVKRKYFVLKPVRDNGSTIFAPTDNEQVLKKMRRLLSAEEINTLIDSMAKEEAAWIANESQRKDVFRATLAGGNHSELIRMIKAIYLHKQEREAAGKRLHMTDDRFFKDAEQILYNEFQYVLKLSNKEELMSYILARIAAK